jgi:hypothetical protein
MIKRDGANADQISSLRKSESAQADDEQVNNDLLCNDEDEDEYEDEWSVRKGDDQYIFYWMQRLLEVDPSSNARAKFVQRARKDLGAKHKERFERRFFEFLEMQALEMPLLDSSLLGFLLDEASMAHGRIAAWNATRKTLEGKDFKEILRYMRRELNRFSGIRKLVAQDRRSAPESVALWMKYRTQAMIELSADTEAELRREVSGLEELYRERKVGFGELESHLLLMTYNKLSSHIKRTPWKRKATVLIAAFAYAARLVPSGSPGSDLVRAIKMRLSRARRSEKHIVYTLRLLLTHG